MIVLLIAASIFGVAACLALGFGIPLKDTTFGSAILLSGVMLLCAGSVLAGLAFVLRELRALRQGLPVQASRGVPAASGLQRPQVKNPFAPSEAEGRAPEPAVSPGSVPWAAEAAARTQSRDEGLAAEAVQPPVEPVVEPVAPERPQRRNLLFASRRRDRAPPMAGSGDPAGMGPAELPPMVQPVLPPMPTLEAEPQAFDSAWPARRQAQSGMPAGGGSAQAEAAAVESQPSPGGHQPAAVTVIKSGVVDGMAYSLYSDGSIEAQMPEGMLRFASLDELRSHLDNRP